MVPGAGVEPARHCCHWCLRPTRLPIPPSGQTVSPTRIGTAKIRIKSERQNKGTKNYDPRRESPAKTPTDRKARLRTNRRPEPQPGSEASASQNSHRPGANNRKDPLHTKKQSQRTTLQETKRYGEYARTPDEQCPPSLTLEDERNRGFCGLWLRPPAPPVPRSWRF